ncbi:MAG: hypothetical protein IJE78_04965 [Bacteroidaceae bacterium]|nr:hypothetical protein [Bacteroidaceae bacterium]
MKRTFRAVPKSKITANYTRSNSVKRSSLKHTVRCSEDNWNGIRDWTESDYFNYLYESYGDDVDGADNEIDYAWGNADLPACLIDVDYSEIQDMYHDWLYSNHPDLMEW